MAKRQPASKASAFKPTQWSLVLAAGGRADTPKKREALSALCEIYWFPLYAFARRSGYAVHPAEDLVQGFFSRLIEHSDVAAANQEKGRFRSFLLASLRHFMANQWDRDHADKRGGGLHILPLDFSRAEDRYQREPAHSLNPERLFERRWALELLDRAIADLRHVYEQSGKLAIFDAMKPLLIARGEEGTAHAELAQRLGMTPDALKTAAHRMRRRYRDTLRQMIADTVQCDADIDDEIRHLFDALKSE